MTWATFIMILKSLATIKAIMAMVAAAFGAITAWFAKRKLDQRKEEIQKAADDLSATNQIKDDNERLKAKADAACKLEKLADPESDCDAANSN